MSRTELRDGAARARVELLRAPMAAGIAAIGAWVVVASLDLERTTLVPCPLLALTGIACPLCGGTRAAHAVAHGEVVSAAGFNIVVLAGIPVAATVWVRWLVRRSRGLRAPFLVLSPRMVTVVMVGLLAFAVLRNLPVGAWFYP